MSEPTQKWTQAVQAYICPECGELSKWPGLCKACMPADTIPKPCAQIDQSSQGQFKPGQTVWIKDGGCEYTVLVQQGTDIWLTHNEEEAFRYNPNEISATDPNQPTEPVPQKCPFCGGDCREIFPSDLATGWRISCVKMQECWAIGPLRPNRLEAIQAWNAIRVIATTLDDLDGAKDRPIELDREQTKAFRKAMTPA